MWLFLWVSTNYCVPNLANNLFCLIFKTFFNYYRLVNNNDDIKRTTKLSYFKGKSTFFFVTIMSFKYKNYFSGVVCRPVTHPLSLYKRAYSTHTWFTSKDILYSCTVYITNILPFEFFDFCFLSSKFLLWKMF